MENNEVNMLVKTGDYAAGSDKNANTIQYHTVSFTCLYSPKIKTCEVCKPSIIFKKHYNIIHIFLYVKFP